MLDADRTVLIHNLNRFQLHVHENASAKGWHDTPTDLRACVAMVVSELGEAIEWERESAVEEPLNSTHIPFTGVEEEMADVMIRILDFAQETGLDVVGAMLAKHEYNLTRPHMHGGKRY